MAAVQQGNEHDPKKIGKLTVGQWQAILAAVVTAVISILGTLLATDVGKPAPTVQPMVVEAAPTPAPSLKPDPISADPGDQITGPVGEVEVGDVIELSVPATVISPIWRVEPFGSDDAVPVRPHESGHVVTMPSKVIGKYRAFLGGKVDDEPILWWYTITISGPPPPDDERPKPTPPSPTPDNKTHPLKVALIYESSNGVPEQFVAPEVEAYLDAHCLKGTDNRPAWRMIDPNLEFTKAAEKQEWESFLVGTYTGLPRIELRAGPNSYSGPAMDTASLLATLKKYGGQ